MRIKDSPDPRPAGVASTRVSEQGTPAQPDAPLASGAPANAPPQGRRGALSFIFVTLLLDVLGFGVLIPVAPRLVEELDAKGEAHGAAMYGMLVATYAAMQFVFAPVLGGLSDRYGRRPVILLSLLGSAIDYVAMALSPTLWFLFVTRAINGVSGANMTACAAYIADVTPPEKRAAGYGMMGAAFGIGFVIGPLLGGVLGEHDIRLPFYVAAALNALNFLYGLFVLPESLDAKHRRAFDWRRANPLGSLARLARFPLALGMAGAMFFLNLATFGLHATWVLYTKHRYHWSPRDVGLSLMVVGLGAAIVQGGLARKLIPILGEKGSWLAGVGLAILAYLGYGLATQGWMIYAIISVASLGAIAGPAGQALLSKAVRPDEQGELQGALTSLQCVAQVAGPLIATQFFRYFIGPAAPAYVPGASFLFGALLCVIGLALSARALR
jgi:DHA1 family tetracycline resistance protein-like MFS transporter